MRNAVALGESKGDTAQAARILDGALTRHRGSAPVTDLVEALAYRAEVALGADDTTAARDTLAQARELTIAEAERAKLGETLAGLDDVEAVLLDDREAVLLDRP